MTTRILAALALALFSLSAHAQLSNMLCSSVSVPAPGDVGIPGPAHVDWPCSISTSNPGTVPVSGAFWQVTPAGIVVQEVNPPGCPGGATACRRYHCDPNAAALQPQFVNGVLSQVTKGMTVRFTTWDKKDKPYTKSTVILCRGPLPDPNAPTFVYVYIEDPFGIYYCGFPYAIGGYCGPYWFGPNW